MYDFQNYIRLLSRLVLEKERYMKEHSNIK